mmetsp:Transcript_75429/g.135919  ORF Transcript_75429/g.135919 Transcript_75429/m.135919 type:complete len:170 (+) Transcript_75429:2160-2669(+)
MGTEFARPVDQHRSRCSTLSRNPPKSGAAERLSGDIFSQLLASDADQLSGSSLAGCTGLPVSVDIKLCIPELLSSPCIIPKLAFWEQKRLLDDKIFKTLCRIAVRPVTPGSSDTGGASGAVGALWNEIPPLEETKGVVLAIRVKIAFLRIMQELTTWLRPPSIRAKASL